jgi:hypothetical protein
MTWKYTNQVAGIHKREPGEYLESSYRYHRRKGVRALLAIERARQDRDAAKMRYLPCESGWNSGQTFEAYGERMRWIENPGKAGLRMVGFADELCEWIQHTGWYTDEHQSETVRGVVYQGPARDGAPLLFAGYDDPNQDGPICIALDTVAGESGGFDGAGGPTSDSGVSDAARQADGIAERMAESEREYSEVTGARSRFEDMGAERADIRTATLALIREFKAAVRIPPGIYLEIESSIRRNLESMADLLRQRAELVDMYGAHDGWTEY